MKEVLTSTTFVTLGCIGLQRWPEPGRPFYPALGFAFLAKTPSRSCRRRTCACATTAALGDTKILL
jgi:hypothetical protein